jgi:hypothetical protein
MCSMRHTAIPFFFKGKNQDISETTLRARSSTWMPCLSPLPTFPLVYTTEKERLVVELIAHTHTHTQWWGGQVTWIGIEH